MRSDTMHHIHGGSTGLASEGRTRPPPYATPQPCEKKALLLDLMERKTVAMQNEVGLGERRMSLEDRIISGVRHLPITNY